jgi:hypothetical protein
MQELLGSGATVPGTNSQKFQILKSFSSVALHSEYARTLAIENLVQNFKSHSRRVALHSKYSRALTSDNFYWVLRMWYKFSKVTAA